MTTVRDAPPRPALSARTPSAPAAGPERRPLRDNPRLILLGIAVLLAALVAMVRLADRSPEMNPDFVSEVVLYALSAADLTMLVALVFVMARNVVKLIVERRGEQGERLGAGAEVLTEAPSLIRFRDNYGITLAELHTPKLKKLWGCRCGAKNDKGGFRHGTHLEPLGTRSRRGLGHAARRRSARG